MADKKKIETTSWEQTILLEVNKHDDAGADLPLDRVDRLQGQAGPSPCQTGLNLSGNAGVTKRVTVRQTKRKLHIS